MAKVLLTALLVSLLTCHEASGELQCSSHQNTRNAVTSVNHAIHSSFSDMAVVYCLMSRDRRSTSAGATLYNDYQSATNTVLLDKTAIHVTIF